MRCLFTHGDRVAKHQTLLVCLLRERDFFELVAQLAAVVEQHPQMHALQGRSERM